MRNRYLVAYDISDPKRLREMFKRMRQYGDPLQYSVFSCDLSIRERLQMEGEIRQVIHQREDRVLIVDLGPAGRRGSNCLTVLGRQLPPAGRESVVI